MNDYNEYKDYFKDYLPRMIQIIPTYPKNIHLQKVITIITNELRKEGKTIPRTIDAIIRNIYNSNCEGYSAFKRRPDDTKPIFKSANPGGGHWSKHPDYTRPEPFSLDDF